jgi:SseB protein N-terminal domain
MSSSAPQGPADAPFSDVARAFDAGEADAHAVHRAFLRSRFWCEAGDRPGLQALGAPGAGVVPVFTSEAELARARGAVRWFSTTGADLLDLLPDRYELVVDIQSDVPLRLQSAAVQRGSVVEIDWRS